MCPINLVIPYVLWLTSLLSCFICYLTVNNYHTGQIKMNYTVIWIDLGIGRKYNIFNADSVLDAINQFMALNLCDIAYVIAVTNEPYSISIA